jgi:hypothetical protein
MPDTTRNIRALPIYVEGFHAGQDTGLRIALDDDHPRAHPADAATGNARHSLTGGSPPRVRGRAPARRVADHRWKVPAVTHD